MAEYTLTETIDSRIKAFIRNNVYTSIPARITDVSKYPTQQTIDAQPIINRTYEDGLVLSLSVIQDIPVKLPAGGGAIISIPLKVGDIVDLSFSMRSLDEFLESDGTPFLTPKDKRTHNLSDATATPCIYTKSSNLKPSADNLEIRFGGAEIVITPAGQISVSAKSGQSVNITGNELNVTTDGDVTVNAGNVSVTAGNVDIDASQVNLGSGGQPIARQGDAVQVIITSGSSAGTATGTIIAGGNNTSI